VGIRTAAARARVRASDEARHRHDMVNALTAVEGAGSILISDHLSPDDRAHLGRLFRSGLHRLRQLVEGAEENAGPVPLAIVAARVVGDWRRPGKVDIDVDADLVALGPAGEVAEAVRLLIVAGYEVAGERLTLHGRRDGPSVGLWLRGIDPWPRPEDVPIELGVADRMVRDYGGEVRVEVAPDGSRSVGICLPAAAPPDDPGDSGGGDDDSGGRGDSGGGGGGDSGGGGGDSGGGG
jgi:uncharacterized membrane protein YgcG